MAGCPRFVFLLSSCFTVVVQCWEDVLSLSVLPRIVLCLSLLWISLLVSATVHSAPAERQGLSAEGVVIASFRQRDNAERRVRGLAGDMAAIDVVLTVLPDGSGLFRVAAQSPQLASRRLLQRLRISGFPDAWHITDNAYWVLRDCLGACCWAAAIRDKTQPKAETSGPISEVRLCRPGRERPS